MDRNDGEDRGTGRRRVLGVAGWSLALPVLGGVRVATERAAADAAGDGIPVRKQRSTTLHRRLESTFGDAFEGLEPGRPDLLLDVRYVEGTAVSEVTKVRIVELFRRNGIYAQWLDHPRTYDRAWVRERYGWSTKALLWDREGLYRETVEPWLWDVALQLFVVPGVAGRWSEGRIYSPTMDALGAGIGGYVNGFSVGNRAVVAERRYPDDEARLCLHEIVHYALCHDDDPGNAGVMGTAEVLDVTAGEWERLRTGLGNVRDTTGYDILLRPCLWEECLQGLAGRG